MPKKKLDDAFEEDIELVDEEQPTPDSGAVHSTRGKQERIGEAIVTSR
jgi:hypothetical protein